MAITKFTDDKSNNKYDEVIPTNEEEMDTMQHFLKKLVDKTDEGVDKTNEHINKIITVGSNTTLSFGDMVFTTVKGKTTYSIVMTVVYTDPSSSKVTTKTTTLTLA